MQYLQTVIRAKLLSKYISLLHSEKVVRIKHLTDDATIVLQKLYYAWLNNLQLDFLSKCFDYKNSDKHI